jgi:hypothetical protein
MGTIYSVHYIHISTDRPFDREKLSITIYDMLHSQTEVRSNSQSSPPYARHLSGPEKGLLVSITVPQESYPDTGESGETYDLEQSYRLETKIMASSSSDDPSQYCDLYPYGAPPYNQWDD